MDTGLMMEYEDILLGKRKDFSSPYMGKDVPEKDVKALLRFVAENFLKWDPITLRDFLKPEILEKLKLNRVVKKLNLPPELDLATDLFYVAWALYPNTIHLSKKTLVLRVYEKVLSGELAKYPKNFFLRNDGDINACICLKYAIEQELHFDNIEEMYSYFGDREEAIHFLKKAKLHVPCNEMYEHPIDMLHETLATHQQNYLIYNHERFKSFYKEAVSSREKLRDEIKKALLAASDIGFVLKDGKDNFYLFEQLNEERMSFFFKASCGLTKKVCPKKAEFTKEKLPDIGKDMVCFGTVPGRWVKLSLNEAVEEILNRGCSDSLKKEYAKEKLYQTLLKDVDTIPLGELYEMFGDSKTGASYIKGSKVFSYFVQYYKHPLIMFCELLSLEEKKVMFYKFECFKINYKHASNRYCAMKKKNKKASKKKEDIDED